MLCAMRSHVNRLFRTANNKSIKTYNYDYTTMHYYHTVKFGNISRDAIARCRRHLANSNTRTGIDAKVAGKRYNDALHLSSKERKHEQ